MNKISGPFLEQSFEFEIIAGTAATSSFTERIKADQNYAHIAGIAIEEITDGNSPDYLVGFKLGSTDIFSKVHNRRFKFGTDMPSAMRFRPLSNARTSDNLYLNLSHGAVSGSSLKFHVILLLTANEPVC